MTRERNVTQSGVLQVIDHSVAGSMTAQPPGFRPSALQIATHGQQVVLLGGGLTPLQRCSWHILQPKPKERECEKHIDTHTHTHTHTPCSFFFRNIHIHKKGGDTRDLTVSSADN